MIHFIQVANSITGPILSTMGMTANGSTTALTETLTKSTGSEEETAAGKAPKTRWKRI